MLALPLCLVAPAGQPQKRNNASTRDRPHLSAALAQPRTRPPPLSDVLAPPVIPLLPASLARPSRRDLR